MIGACNDIKMNKTMKEKVIKLKWTKQSFFGVCGVVCKCSSVVTGLLLFDD